MNNNILVVYGGDSVEHEISIITMLQVYSKYQEHGKYNLIPCYLKKGHFYTSHKLLKLKNYQDLNLKSDEFTFCAEKKWIIVKHKKYFFEAVWILSHGVNCEDGTIASFFKTLNIPFIAEDIYSASLGQSKELSKRIVSRAILPFYSFTINEYKNNLDRIIGKAYDLEFPLIVKPNELGSSVGIKKVSNVDELIDTLNEVFNLSKNIEIEKCLNDFEEYNIALFKNKNELLISSIEKVSHNKVLSYQDKYCNSKNSMEGQIKELPAIISDELKQEIISNASTVYEELKAKYIVRIDYLYDNINKKLYFNEINNIPGSLALYLFKENGYNPISIIDKLIDEGLKEIDQNSTIITTYKENIFKENISSNMKFNK